ncbi:MAG: Fic family protein [Dehalococcoidia bacterium]
MSEQFTLVFDKEFVHSSAILGLEDLLYVVRALIPPGFEEAFRQRAIYANAHSTVAIEGNPISREDALRVSVEGADNSNPDEVEIENIETAYDLIHQLSGDATVAIDQGLIRTLNSIILRNIEGAEAEARGRYRTRENAVVAEGSHRVLYRPPAPSLVSPLMDALEGNIKEWRERYPPAIAAALAHFGLVSIHPFEDGNGRTARLIAHMMLEKSGDSVESLLHVNEAILRLRGDYYEVLRETQGPRFKPEVDVQPFVAFHTRALALAAARLQREAISFARWRDKAIEESRGALNERQVTGLMFLTAVPRPLSSSAYAKIAKTSQTTAVADLNDLVDSGILDRLGRGPGTRYQLSAPFREATLVDEEEDEGAQVM